MEAEFDSLATYAISQKGAYSTPDLIEHAENMIPETTRKLLPPGVTKDVQEAGRCLVFDLPTASGFHILRAVELVMIELWQHIKQTGDKKPTNWGAYIDKFDKSSIDAKIPSLLRDLKDLYRNPTLHPEVTLDEDEATTLLALGVAAHSTDGRSISRLQLGCGSRRRGPQAQPGRAGRPRALAPHSEPRGVQGGGCPPDPDPATAASSLPGRAPRPPAKQQTGRTARASATWDQVDFDAAVWTATVKGGDTHRVPLTDAALAILRAQQGQHTTYVFPESAEPPAALARRVRPHLDGCRHRQHDSRFPVVLLDMGERCDRLLPCDDRAGHGAQGREFRQPGIRPGRPFRKAPRPDGGLDGARDRGEVARPAGAERPPPTVERGRFCVRARWGRLYGPVRPFTGPARCRQPDPARAP